MFSVGALPILPIGNSTTIFGSTYDSSSLCGVFLALLITFLFICLHLATAKVRVHRVAIIYFNEPCDNILLQTPAISPPCEKVIEEAERTNRRNGHENAGFLSKEAAFMPLETMKAFPPSHSVWDQLTADLPRLVQAQSVRKAVTEMPLLDASSKLYPKFTSNGPPAF
jgi:hypothetical protein